VGVLYEGAYALEYGCVHVLLVYSDFKQYNCTR
jgi:hypothetical protein